MFTVQLRLAVAANKPAVAASFKKKQRIATETVYFLRHSRSPDVKIVATAHFAFVHFVCSSSSTFVSSRWCLCRLSPLLSFLRNAVRGFISTSSALILAPLSIFFRFVAESSAEAKFTDSGGGRSAETSIFTRFIARCDFFDLFFVSTDDARLATRRAAARWAKTNDRTSPDDSRRA